MYVPVCLYACIYACVYVCIYESRYLYFTFGETHKGAKNNNAVCISTIFGFLCHNNYNFNNNSYNNNYDINYDDSNKNNNSNK